MSDIDWGEVEKDTYKWANYKDLKELDLDIMDRAVKAAFYYCWDAVNLSFTLKSSTSGMYSSWSVAVSPDCTVRLHLRPPTGSGRHINSALLSFISSCEKGAKEVADARSVSREL